MRVRVRYYALFRDVVGRSEELLEIDEEEASLATLLNELVKKYPKLSDFLGSGRFIVLRNSQPVSDRDLNTSLTSNDVIDLMPPPSGGSFEVKLLRGDEPLVITDVIRELKGVEGIERAGALAIYVGFVKGLVNNTKVRELTYEVHEEYTINSIKRMVNDILMRNPNIVAIKVYHRVGSYRPGDDVFYVFVAGVSRHDVIPALMEVVERVKHETGIWKLERREDGTFWVLGDGERVGMP